MASYTIVYRDSTGSILATINDFFSLEYARRENEFGFLYLDLPPIYPKGFFIIDGRIEVYRTNDVGTTKLDMDAVWYILLVRTKTEETGKKFIHIVAHDGISLLDRRIIPYSNVETETKTNKAVAADNFIKQIIYENFSAGATDVERNLGEYLKIDNYATTSICPVVTMKKFGNRKVLPLIQDVANQSIKGGVYLAFDLVYENEIAVRFKTYTEARGVNRGSTSGSPYILSLEAGNINYASLTYDYSESINFIYAGDIDGILATGSDPDTLKISPYARREDFINVDKNDDTTWQPEVNQRLSETKPRISINTHIQKNYNSLYGVHFGFGDIVVAVYEGVPIDVHLDAVSVRVDQSQKDNISILAKNYDEE